MIPGAIFIRESWPIYIRLIGVTDTRSIFLELLCVSEDNGVLTPHYSFIFKTNMSIF